MPRLKRLARYFLILVVIGLVLGAGSIGVAYWLLSPRMPPVEALQHVELQVPLRVVTEDGKLIATYGVKRRIPVSIDAVPRHLKQAVIAAEDAGFYNHPGFDWKAILRAGWHVILAGGKKTQGASTITQQVARSFFLSPQKLYTRKILEIFIAVRMEHHLSKDEILQLYLNKMFMGHRSYGVAAAADYYYGESLDQLSLAQCAMLAGLFQLPSVVNPVTSPQRAVARRNWVLGQMQSKGFINKSQYKQAVAEADHAFPHKPPVQVHAPYVAEMARRAAIREVGDKAMTDGYVVVTSIHAKRQRAARQALRKGLASYDRRHGYRGPIEHVDLRDEAGFKDFDKILQTHHAIAGMLPALVTQVADNNATLYLQGGATIALGFKAVAWARPRLSINAMGPRPKRVGDVLKAGDVVRVARNDEGDWKLAEIPSANGALVSLNPHNGAIEALVGGFDFEHSKYNRALNAKRQPGSAFKPFLYSASLDRGFTAASIVNDAPIAVPDPTDPNGMWTPSNAAGKFAGPMRVRMGLVKSKNLVSIRLLDAIGIRYMRHFATRFGLPIDSLPKGLSLALGSASLTPLTMATGYAVFANGGYRVQPWLIAHIKDRNGTTVFESSPFVACRDCENLEPPASPASSPLATSPAHLLPLLATNPGPDDNHDSASVQPAPRVIDAGNAFIMTSMMKDVIRIGTGHAASVLQRPDLGGKTGTTDDHRDAWFCGFNSDLVAVVWVGNDDYGTLGRHEYGATAALPIWIDYMGPALAGTDKATMAKPDSVLTAKINPRSGLLATPDEPNAISEFFRKDALERLAARSPEPGKEKDDKHAFDIF